jgi:hypothetical protein
MKRFLAVGALLAAMASAVFVARADAILFGTPDGNDHKGVGYIVFYDATRTPLWRCSGSLVATRVVLTAGHCAGTYDDSNGVFHTPVLAQVWFDKDIQRSKDYPAGPAVPCVGFSKGFPCSGGDSYGVPIAHPLYSGSHAAGVVNDIGVVRLFSAQKSKDVLELAPLGTLDRTPARTPMTIVGFGLQAPPPPLIERQRMRGTVTFLRVEGNPSPAFPFDDPTYADFTNGSPDGAAACFGDSGGPVINPSGAIVALLSVVDPTVDGFCVGDGYHYRTDTADSLRFLALFGVRAGGSGQNDGGQNEGGQQNGQHGDGHSAKHGANTLLAR